VKFYTEEPQRIEVRQIEGYDGVRTSAFPLVVSSDSPPIGAERRGWLSATSSGLTIGQACATVEACTSSVRTFVHVWRGEEEKKNGKRPFLVCAGRRGARRRKNRR
jgi:hypothetical protein